MPWFEQSADVTAATTTKAFLESSGIVYGTIGSSFDTDWYRMDMQAGVKYTVMFNALTAGLKGNLVLRDASGNVIYSVPVTSGINMTPPVSGTFYWSVEGAGTTGLYSLTATNTALDDTTANAATMSTLILGQTKSGNIETWSDADWHKVSLIAGHVYAFTKVGGTLQDPFLSIFATEDGGMLSSSDKGTLVFTPTQSGVYYLDVGSNSSRGVGTYQIHAQEIPVVDVTSQKVMQGAGGTQNMTFTLTLSVAVSYNVTVTVDTKDETAVAGLDYQAIHQVVTFQANTTTATVTVPTFGNGDFLPFRAFELNLSNAVGALIAPKYDDPAGTPQSNPQPNAWGGILNTSAGSYGSLPSDTYFSFEWYLFTTRAVSAWKHATGLGIKIAVFDQGIDATNHDLAANTAVSLGRTASNLSAGGAPVLATDNHGTLVAGVIAAARDGQGVVGVAYDAQLVPIYTSASINQQYLTEIKNAFSYARNFDVLNDSWGFGNLLAKDTNWAFLDNANDPAFAPAFQALHDLAAYGRNGLGTIVVQSAGNAFEFGDDTNLHNFQNSRYIITVGSTDYFGSSSSFSTTGASILVSAPGGAGHRNFNSILTTDRSGSAGENASSVAFSDGTSFSAPIVSGIVALMLQTNAHLGYRDVQQILAYTAHQTNIGIGTWADNGAIDWNGGGLRYNSVAQSSGFGQVDALAAVRLAAAWNAPAQTDVNAIDVRASQTVNKAIPDNNLTGVYNTIHISSALAVERVDVTVNITHPFIGDLEVTLFSPSGTASYLMYRPSQGSLSAYGSSQDNVHFTFNTVLDWGEAASGNWTLNVRDLQAGDTGSFDSWSIDLIGHASSPDHTFIYTNEFPSLVAADPSRGVLSDPDGGIDTINTGALGSDDRIDLSGATTSIINGGNLTIAKGTVIRNAYGGEGNDTLIANDAGSVLHGMDGKDILMSGAGNDVLIGGAGDDILIGLKGKDLLYGGDGADTLQLSVSSLQVTVIKLRDHSFIVKDSAGDIAIAHDVEQIRYADKVVQTSGLPIHDDLDSVLTQIYVAGFRRAPETGGYNYWKQEVATKGLATVADTIFSLDIVQSIYPAEMAAEQFVAAIYRNVFNRAPDSGGLAYWTHELNSSSRGMLVIDMTIAALGVPDGTDGKDYFQNRTDWALYAVGYQAAHGEMTTGHLGMLTDSINADGMTALTLIGQAESGALI